MQNSIERNLTSQLCLLNSHPSSFTGLSPGKLKLWFGPLYPGRGAVTVLTTRAASVSGGATLGESRSARSCMNRLLRLRRVIAKHRLIRNAASLSRNDVDWGQAARCVL